MDNTRITISLEQCERSALMRLAKAEMRSPRDQARYILLCELQRRGLLPADDRQVEAQAEEVGDGRG